MNEEPNRTRFIREWIIFSICVGFGGHIALGLLLHAPENWTMTQVGWYGFLISLFSYIVVQIGRSAWRFWMVNERNNRNTKFS